MQFDRHRPRDEDRRGEREPEKRPHDVHDPLQRELKRCLRQRRELQERLMTDRRRTEPAVADTHQSGVELEWDPSRRQLSSELVDRRGRESGPEHDRGGRA